MNILRPAIFLAEHEVLDNVDPARVRLLAGARALRAAGDPRVLGAHPSGVARGLFAPDALAALCARLEDLLGLPLDGFAHHPEGILVAPAIERARRIDLPPTWMVDDLLARSIVQVPASFISRPRIKRTTITQATADYPANKAPAIGHSLLPTLDPCARLRVLVIGEALLDACLDGHTKRREAPVVHVATRRDAPGGGAHTAVDAVALGARVTFLSAVGDDEHATRLGAALEALGVPGDALLRAAGRRTRLKQRVLASGRLLLRLDAGSSHDLASVECAHLRAILRAAWHDADAVIVSDHAHGVLTPALIAELALAAGASAPASADLAACAASVAHRRDGTTTRSAAGRQHKVLPTEQLGPLADDLHRAGKRVVFTHGCFDARHRGHVTDLGHAKALGDVLIVGLNSDDNVRHLEGASWPLHRATDRARALAALPCVDHIVESTERSPMALLERARPDYYVKGGDYTRATLPEAPQVERLGGQVRLLPHVEDLGTTGILMPIGGRQP
jgi:rfaE bifunctional protein nucleotidyltransferase chain/domain